MQKKEIKNKNEKRESRLETRFRNASDQVATDTVSVLVNSFKAAGLPVGFDRTEARRQMRELSLGNDFPGIHRVEFYRPPRRQEVTITKPIMARERRHLKID